MELNYRVEHITWCTSNKSLQRCWTKASISAKMFVSSISHARPFASFHLLAVALSSCLQTLGCKKIYVFLPHHVRKFLKTRQIGGQTNCYLLPLLARRHALLQGDHAGLDVAIEDGLQVDLPTATRDDLIGDLSGTADAAWPWQAAANFLEKLLHLQTQWVAEEEQRSLTPSGTTSDHAAKEQKLRKKHNPIWRRFSCCLGEIWTRELVVRICSGNNHAVPFALCQFILFPMF